jgi:hypothetical protein
MFSKEEIIQIEAHGLTTGRVEAQIENFINGFPPSKLISALGVGNGIFAFNQSDCDELLKNYEENLAGKTVVKFVPASGAATRMFKNLYAFLSDYSGSEKDYQELISDTGKDSVFTFLKKLEQFAFYHDLKAKFNGEMSVEEAHVKRKYLEIIGTVLHAEGLNYGALPKGLLKFHKYENGSRTPVEEHIVEGCAYAKTDNKRVSIHFTVSPEHMDSFKSHVSEVKESYENEFGVSLDITYSIQKPKTDTIAVDMNNAPFKENGQILFRPAGHGALLENLNDIDADVIFIKNIDNVVPDALKEETIAYKKIIGGLLLQTQEKIFNYLNMLDTGNNFPLNEIKSFIQEELGYQASEDLDLSEIRLILNRPLRVCGIVKNTGEPGGGPFSVRNDAGVISPQIVETAQIDMGDAAQKGIFQKSTHFSPTDIVCGVRDYKGQKFDLLEFRDPSTGFITKKSKDGKDLKAQELPGLWNGSMANWNTLFVEVPLITFNPVKSVNDLLKKEHQPQ